MFDEMTESESELTFAILGKSDNALDAGSPLEDGDSLFGGGYDGEGLGGGGGGEGKKWADFGLESDAVEGGVKLGRL